MKKYIFSVLGLVIILLAFVIGSSVVNQNKIGQNNLCVDEDLVAKLISNNVNPFTKFQFIKKRNSDCEILLKENKEEALMRKDSAFCPYIEASTNSITLLVLTYINEMYDRETASKELKEMLKLMPPYDYCPEYMPSIIDLIKLKRKFGLL